MMKDQKGITLVALIITIIVMLILVAVTISVAMNGGLFTNARNAREGTVEQQVKEAVTLAKAEMLSDFYANNITAPDASGAGTSANPSVRARVLSYLDGKYDTTDMTVTSSTPWLYTITVPGSNGKTYTETIDLTNLATQATTSNS